MDLLEVPHKSSQTNADLHQIAYNETKNSSCSQAGASSSLATVERADISLSSMSTGRVSNYSSRLLGELRDHKPRKTFKKAESKRLWIR